MPELPEVETTRRGIARYVEKKKIIDATVRQANLRWAIHPHFAKKIRNQKVLALKRRGKYLLFDLGHYGFMVHLGMSGSLRVLSLAQAKVIQKHDHVDLEMSGGKVLRYNDPRRFGAFVLVEKPFEEHALLSHLGPEPLAKDFTPEYLFTCSRGRKTRIKAFIMDSKVVVGVGNIYANESLFNAGIHPMKATGKISRRECEVLVNEIKRILQYAIKRGGTTLRDFVGGDGKPGYFAQELKVYGRGGEPCDQCKKILSEKVLAQRSTVYCVRCQK